MDILFKPMCLSLVSLKHSIHKDLALQGLLKIVIKNPSGALVSLVYLADLVVNYDGCPKETLDKTKDIFVCFKLSLKNLWNSYIAAFPEEISKELVKMLKL